MRRRLIVIASLLLLLATPNQPLLPLLIGAVSLLGLLLGGNLLTSIARRWLPVWPQPQGARLRGRLLHRGAVAVSALALLALVGHSLLVTLSEPPRAAAAGQKSSLVAVGDMHSLAVRSDGTVWAWGDNSYGQLGVTAGSACGSPCGASPVPIRVSALSGVAVAVAGGGAHSLALLSDGSVRAWGANNYGQLGDGTATNRAAPAPVSGLSGVADIAAGGNHSLALLADSKRTVRAWGDNSYGQLGNTNTGSCPHPGALYPTYPCSLTPVAVSNLSGVTAISAGDQHSLAVLSDGTVMGWGDDNAYDQAVGASSPATRTPSGPTCASNSDCVLIPGPVSGVSGAAAVLASSQDSFILLSGGTVLAWGWNSGSRLGIGTAPYVGSKLDFGPLSLSERDCLPYWIAPSPSFCPPSRGVLPVGR